MLVRKNNSEVLSILAKKLEVDPKDSKKLMKKLKSIPAKEILSLNDEVLAVCCKNVLFFTLCKNNKLSANEIFFNCY